MPANVLHFRPRISTANIKSGNPVIGNAEWEGLGRLANWCNGHGAMLVPWTAVNYMCAAGAAGTFHFYVAPKARAVERVWRVALSGAPCTVACGSAAAVAVSPPALDDAAGHFTFEFRESLAAKTSTPAGTTVVVDPAGTGNTVVYAISCYEQTRGRLDLDTTDYGVDLRTLRSRRQIADLANKSVAGVGDAYVNLDARRSGFFHWSSNVSDAASYLDVTQVGYTALFPLHVPMTMAVFTTVSSPVVTVAAYAKVNAGSANIRFTADESTDSIVLPVTGTSFAWVTDILAVDTEDLTTADGRRGAAWEGVLVEAQKDTSTTLSIAALSIVRGTAVI